MGGRACYEGAVRLDLIIRGDLEPGLDLLNYAGGVMDTLGGSHGFTFTFLPIVYEDDCQVRLGSFHLTYADEPSYKLRLEFLHDEAT